MNAPVEIQSFISFAALLRDNGFFVASDQIIGFLKSIRLLGPRNIEDIRRAAIALFAIPKDREPQFDELFRAHFLGMEITLPATFDEEKDFEAHEDRGQEPELLEAEESEESGQAATELETLRHRELIDLSDLHLQRFKRLAPQRLPKRSSCRFVTSRRGNSLDARKTLRAAMRLDGEMINLVFKSRKLQPRKIVLMIDVSGSMKEGTDATMRFAHSLVSLAERAEVFSLGTRLTRITSALRIKNTELSLKRVGAIVSDIDGGTRIGEGLQAFLNMPRFVGLARGAIVVIISDGLERGDPEMMISGLQRLSLIAWHLSWLTPLAQNDGFVPETSALAASMPYIDDLGNGSSASDIADAFLNLRASA